MIISIVSTSADDDDVFLFLKSCLYNNGEQIADRKKSTHYSIYLTNNTTLCCGDCDLDKVCIENQINFSILVANPIQYNSQIENKYKIDR